RPRIHDRQLDGTKQGAVPCPAPGTVSHLYHHRSDRLRGGTEHSDLSHDDGHGKNQGHCGAHVDGHAPLASPTPVYRSGRCYRSIRNGYWPHPWVCVVLDRRPLSPDLALARGLLHRLRALRSTRRGRRFGRPGGDWCVLYIDPVPIMVRRPDFAGGSSAVRIKRSWTAPADLLPSALHGNSYSGIHFFMVPTLTCHCDHRHIVLFDIRYTVFRVCSWKQECAGTFGLVPCFNGMRCAGFGKPPARGLGRNASVPHPMKRAAMLRIEGLKKVFRSGDSDLVLFDNLSFQVNKGEMLAIVGESGAGKSTL